MQKMILKELIKKLEEFDEYSEVWIDFNYFDSDEGECYDSFNNFRFKKATSWNGKPVLHILERD